MRKCNFPWISSLKLVEAEGEDLSYLRGMGSTAAPKPQPATAAYRVKKPPKNVQQPQGVPAASAPAPLPQPEAPLAPFQAMTHHEPTLAQKVAPDLPNHHERLAAFQQHFQNPQYTRVRNLNRQSTNPVFHAQTPSGNGVVFKPHSATHETHEPEKQHGRDQFMQHAFSAMGAHHMVLPAMQAQMPHAHQVARGIEPSEDPASAHPHQGQAAHAVEFAPGLKHLHEVDPKELDKIDAEHRLTGAVAHVLAGSTDAHSANHFYDPRGFPVGFDFGLSGDSLHNLGGKQQHGTDMDTHRSVFAPGGRLDYRHGYMTDPATGQQRKQGEVGNSYPPRIRKMLQFIADGGRFEGHEGTPQDLAVYRRNAQELLSNGLENTFRNRFIETGGNKGYQWDDTVPQSVPNVAAPRAIENPSSLRNPSNR